MTAPNKMAKRAAAGTLALAVCLGGGVLGAGAAQADASFAFDNRVAGADRIVTAVEASKDAYPTSAGTVIVVNDEATVDGLTASYAAGLNDAPILYVKRDSIPSETAAEITRLGATKVIIVGGTTVVSTGVETSLKSGNKTVTRYSGSDRYATAAAVATSGSAKPGKVFIANGNAPADALAAGPIAFAKKYPVLLTESADVPSATNSALNTLAVDTRVVLGGNTVVSTTTYTDLKGTSRLGGENRQETATRVADFATGSEGFAGVNLGLVGPEDRNTADALIASPLLGKQQAPLLFTARGSISTPTSDYLKANAAKLTGEGYVFGGEVAVPSNIAAEGTAAAGGTSTTPGGSNQRIAVTPNTTESRTLASSETVGGVNGATQADADRDNRTYTASGLQNGKTYRITLVDSRNIAIDNSGVVTFRSSADADARTKFSADTGDDDANIVRVNGEIVSFGTGDAARTITAQPENGNITFEIDGESVGDVTPVVYLNGSAGTADAEGGTSIRLETSATKAGQYAAPIEPFGLGGKTTYDAAQAATGQRIVGADIETVNKENNSFQTNALVAGTNTPAVAASNYRYDDSDTFKIEGVEVDLAAFEAALSTADSFNTGSTYNRDASLVSVFDLDNLNPSQVVDLTAENGDGTDQNDIELTFSTPDTTADLDQFVIQRATVTGTQAQPVLGPFSTIATITAGDETPTTGPANAQVGVGTQASYVDNDRPAGRYAYRVAGINDGDTGTYSEPSGPVTTVTSDTTAPTIVDARILNNAGNAFALEVGDSFRLIASEALAGPQAGDALRVQDADGTILDLVAGGSANFAAGSGTVRLDGTDYDANRQLVVTITNAAPVASGTTAGLSSISNIVAQSGNTDEQGNRLQLSGDVVVDDEGGTTTAAPPAPPAPPAADTTPPQLDGAEVINATTVDATFDEAVTVLTAGAVQFSYDPDGPGGDAPIVATAANALGSVVTLTFPTGTADAAAIADTLTYTQGGVANRVKDIVGNDAASPTTVSPN